ncbi:hypothetical protein THASP1DRAFT_32723 [Thamnocephalis sphaerospora]|uniref:Uncharacterized protein n=1 Tax=Thamnocephalis sphaerospora TaxID=78915 RepID=A0A4P9XJA0_9FUNG|nr:hypothetical protein THASP1DRAFT_32723 [Thamnocephalis sphaerospora]|eukprot:RKP05431.1 hypothetical protein THASP1DRAFT_32723 [Thamnocephalis sphaerospora]
MSASQIQFFDDIQTKLDAESDTRDRLRQVVKELDHACRCTNATLNRVHADPAHLGVCLC